MEKEKVKHFVRQLESRWYKRHAKNLVGNDDYAYMKTTRNADGEFKHIIVLGAAGDERIDVVLTRPKFSVADCEEIAEKLVEFFKPYFDKYGETTIFKAKRKVNNYCKKCRLRDGCLQKCKEAEVYEQGYNDAVKEFKTKSNGIQRKDP